VAFEDDDPASWRLDIQDDRIDLYVELINEPRALTADEAMMLVDLIHAWRELEYRKHVALRDVKAQLQAANDSH
jgi:hypothetical protein